MKFYKKNTKKIKFILIGNYYMTGYNEYNEYYKFYSKRCGLYSSPEKEKINVRYYESSSIEDTNGIIEKYSLEDKTGKEIQNVLNSNGIHFEKLLKLSCIYNDWFLYKSDQIIGASINLL